MSSCIFELPNLENVLLYYRIIILTYILSEIFKHVSGGGKFTPYRPPCSVKPFRPKKVKGIFGGKNFGSRSKFSQVMT